jgi:hypothetical protein
MNTVQNLYNKFGSQIILISGMIYSGAILIYMIDDNHKYKVNNLKKCHKDEIQKLHNEINTMKINYNNGKSIVF